MLILSGPGEGGGAAQPVIGRARAAQPSSGAAHEPVRLAADGIVVIGNADPVELGKLFEVAADARSALAALVPGTASRVFPLTVFIDCGEQSPGPGIHEQKWGLHVVLRCRASLDGRDGIELHARLLLQQAVRSLPLWLEVGSARLAARVERARDGGLLIGQPAVDDLAGYRFKPVPVRDVFSATKATNLWTDSSLQGPFVRQAWLYVRHLAATGSLDRCLDWPAENVDPEAQLRQCLGTDLDTFHAAAMERWAEGAKAIPLAGSVPPMSIATSGLDADVFDASRVDALLAANAVKDAQKRAAAWMRVQPQGPEVAAIAGRLTVLSGDAPAAASAFERSLATRFDPVVAYHYASALVSPGVRAGSASAIEKSDAAKAEALLTRVVEAFPLADAMALLGIARLRSGDAGGAVQSLSDAVHAWPRHDYALWLARALASSRQTAAARRTAGPLQEIGETDAIRKAARELIQHLPGDDGEAGLIPVLPPLAAGQLRTEGRLRDIDCGPDWTVLLLEQEGGTRARFATARLSLPTFMFFGTQPAPVRCGRREAPEHVVITWRADERTPSGSTGIIVSVAFLAGPDGRP